MIFPTAGLGRVAAGKSSEKKVKSAPRAEHPAQSTKHTSFAHFSREETYVDM